MYVQDLGADTASKVAEASSDDQMAAAAAAKLREHLSEAWGPFPGWVTGIGAVQLPNGQYVVEVGLAPGIGRLTLPEVPSQVDGIPVIMTKGVVSLRYPRRMEVGGGWPLSHYGRPVGG